MSNTIFWGDSTTGTRPEIWQVSGSGTTTVNTSVIEGGCSSDVTCFGAVIALQDKCGPTQTMMLTDGSSAIDDGYNATRAAQDQRSVPRPQGPNCDVGAVEVAFQRQFSSADALLPRRLGYAIRSPLDKKCSTVQGARSRSHCFSAVAAQKMFSDEYFFAHRCMRAMRRWTKCVQR